MPLSYSIPTFSGCPSKVIIPLASNFTCELTLAWVALPRETKPFAVVPLKVIPPLPAGVGIHDKAPEAFDSSIWLDTPGKELGNLSE